MMEDTPESMVHHDNIYVFSFDGIFVCEYVISWCMCVCMCMEVSDIFFMEVSDIFFI